MRDLAPQVFRQRLLMEAIFTRPVDEEAVRQYLGGLAQALGLRAYGQPLVHSPAGQGCPGNQGYDAFLHLVDSGIAAYVWSQARLVSVVVYSCKAFDPARAAAFTGKFFVAAGEVQTREF